MPTGSSSTRRPPLPGGPYLVVGLARSGVAAAEALRARGEEVIGCDTRAAGSPELDVAAQRLSRTGVEVHLDASGEAVAARAGTLIKSPGVPQNAPAVVAARARGVPVIGELELAWRLLSNEFIAVTGTNGKTTTTEWIGHIHRTAALPVAVAGNVGTAASTLAGTISPETTVVCEASSFQLEDTVAFAPEAAVLLNLAPDHLDRHPTLRGLRRGQAEDLRQPGQRRPRGRARRPRDRGSRRLRAPRPVRRQAMATRWSSQTGPDTCGGTSEPLIDVDEIALPGAHNRANAMAAAAVCLARGIEPDAVAEALRTFAGVAHRLEAIAVRDGVAYVNDSKATNVASAIVALESYDGGVHLIAGGRGKNQDFSPLAEPVAERCAAVYLIGEASAELAGALGATGVALHRSGDLDHAVAAAAATASARGHGAAVARVRQL